MTTQNSYYDRFFAQGGWKYDLAAQRKILQQVLVPLTTWGAGDTLIEVGAGMGHHAEILRSIGLDVTAVEASSEGVNYAKKHYPKLKSVCADASLWNPDRPAKHVFARGMSFFHYELDGVNCKGVDVPTQTRRMFEWIEDGGTFTLQIVTDFSGRKDAVHMNTMSAYRDLFSQFGEIETIADFSGRDISRSVRGADRGIIIVTRKTGHDASTT